ncbi:sigma-70 family RNA polymerase sigma factor [Pseudonocardia sp. D17]|uniref:sigma-70 family RNA polymerase sigma factor n=1 Tax=Pseudonocardia sp. D17 TaxID=882661 RepID=UPI002B3F6B2E|nr:hypothetical protein PSD17_04640 [Pseudonocardia sp. D17]
MHPIGGQDSDDPDDPDPDSSRPRPDGRARFRTARRSRPGSSAAGTGRTGGTGRRRPAERPRPAEPDLADPEPGPGRPQHAGGPTDTDAGARGGRAGAGTSTGPRHASSGTGPVERRTRPPGRARPHAGAGRPAGAAPGARGGGPEGPRDDPTRPDDARTDTPDGPYIPDGPDAPDAPDRRGGQAADDEAPPPTGGGGGDGPRPPDTPRGRDDALIDGWARKAADGDKIALRELLILVNPLVVRYCRSHLGAGRVGLSGPEDVAQEVMVAVCRALPGFDRTRNPFMAFVYGIAQNKIADTFRAARRDRTIATDEVPEGADMSGGPEHEALRGDVASRISGMLDRLPDSTRKIMVYRLGLGYSADETAELVGMTAGAVRVAQHRAMQKLRGWATELGY